jgi:hypothetical protein
MRVSFLVSIVSRARVQHENHSARKSRHPLQQNFRLIPTDLLCNPEPILTGAVLF